MNQTKSILVLLLSGISLTSQVQAEALQISSEQRQSLDLTLYNQNLGLVRETRKLPPLNPNQPVILEDVSQQLEVESLRIENAGNIQEQNLNTNLLSQQTLLKYYIGKNLLLARFNPVTGKETTDKVELLSISGQQILVRNKDHYESIPLYGQWRFIFPQIPNNLLSKPSLSFRTSGTSKSQNAHISYLTAGLNWRMDYVATLNKAGTQISLDGLASLTNQTGTDFINANISLVAGDINNPRQDIAMMRNEKLAYPIAAAPSLARSIPQENLDNFHLFKLPNLVNLMSGQIKQVSFLSAKDIPVTRKYDYQFFVSSSVEKSRYDVKPNLTLIFQNDKKSNLGLPIPAGNIRAFSPDSLGQLQFIGGSQISHSAEGEEIKVRQGKAFDISIQRKQTYYNATFDGYKVVQELNIRNSRETPAELTITADFPLEWEIQNSSHEYRQIAGSSAQWILKIPAKDDITLNFQAKMKKHNP